MVENILHLFSNLNMLFKTIFLVLTSTLSLFAEYMLSYGNVNIGNPQIESGRQLPIHFISNQQNRKEANQQRFKQKVSPKHNKYNYEYQENSDDYQINESWNVEVGIKFMKDTYLAVSDNFSDISINRQIEFYREEFFSPYLRFNFQDIKLNSGGYFVMRNSLEMSFINFDKQVPFLADSGQFPSQLFYDVGTEINSLSLFWKGSFLYKLGFFSIGGYGGAGLNFLDGSALYLRFPTDINSTLAKNIAPFNNGKILEKGEKISLNLTSSAIIKYGASVNIDFKLIHLSIGINFGVTNELDIYWIEKNYFLELGYIF